MATADAQDSGSGRQRVLQAVAFGSPDPVPVHFDFGVLRDGFRRRGIDDPDRHFGVDLKKIWFVPKVAPSEEYPDPPRRAGTPRIGNIAQVANYRMWNYAPQCIDRRNPLLEARRIEDIDRYPFPTVDSAGESERLREAVQRLHDRGFAVAGQIPHLGGVIFETAYRLRGLDNLLEDFRSRSDFAEALLDRITRVAAGNVAHLAAAGVDIVVLGDDIGTSTSMLISPDLWRRWLKGRLARIIQAAREVVPGIAIAYHSDGWFLPVLKDLVEIGVGILNPVQGDCMDPVLIRRRFGAHLAFWGTVGAARLLPYASPGEVYREVRRRIESLAGGGLILGPAYDLEDNVPVENVEAFFQACRPPTR